MHSAFITFEWKASKELQLPPVFYTNVQTRRVRVNTSVLKHPRAINCNCYNSPAAGAAHLPMIFLPALLSGSGYPLQLTASPINFFRRFMAHTGSSSVSRLHTIVEPAKPPFHFRCRSREVVRVYSTSSPTLRATGFIR